MNYNTTVSIYHDTRRPKNNGLSPVKLRVYHNKIKKRYPTGIDLSVEQFKKSYLTRDPKGQTLYKGELVQYSKIKNLIIELELKASRIISEMDKFTFERFENKMKRPLSLSNDLFTQYEEKIKILEEGEQIKTAISYNSSMASLKEFLKHKGKKSTTLNFNAVTVAFLNEYERWMLSEGRSTATIGMYLRSLRALFNDAKERKEISEDIYPFGKRLYQIPVGKKVKKTLHKDELKKLFNYKLPEDSFMYKARNFWFLSYLCSGINMRDIAELRQKNISDSTIVYIRQKTRRTTKTNPVSIKITLTEPIKEIIKKYGNNSELKEDYVFPILNKQMTAKEKVRAVESFTRFVNQHIKKLAKLSGVNPEISTYFARHSFSHAVIQAGFSKEYVQQQFGHQSISTTENYFSSFEDSTRESVDSTLLNFLNE